MLRYVILRKMATAVPDIISVRQQKVAWYSSPAAYQADFLLAVISTLSGAVRIVTINTRYQVCKYQYF